MEELIAWGIHGRWRWLYSSLTRWGYIGFTRISEAKSIVYSFSFIGLNNVIDILQQ
jgi:hypothetical protein